MLGSYKNFNRVLTLPDILWYIPPVAVVSNGLGHLDVRFALPNAFGRRVIRQGHYRNAHLSGFFVLRLGLCCGLAPQTTLSRRNVLKPTASCEQFQSLLLQQPYSERY